MDRNHRDVASAHVNLVEAARYERIHELLRDPERTKRDIEWEFAPAQNEFRKERRKASIYLDGMLAVYQILRILLPPARLGSRF
jgi:hypothetical protein